MIDFIKGRFKDKQKLEQFITNSSKFEKQFRIDPTSGQLDYPLISSLASMDIRVTNKTAIIRNSIHKYWNDITTGEKQNYSDFNFMDLQRAISQISHDLDTPLEDIVLTQLEFGLNIDLSMDVKDFIEDNVKLYKLRHPCWYPKHKANFCIKRWDYN